MAETTKTTPAGPLREPLPPIYPIPLIEVACRVLEAVAALKASAIASSETSAESLSEGAAAAARIVRNGLASHELAAQEGRSRG